MGVFKKGENWYIDYYVQGRRKREKIGPSKVQAQVVLQKRKVQIAEGKFLDVQGHQKVKFEEMGKLFLENYSKPNKRSWRRDEEIVGHLVDFFKGKNLYEITPLDIEKYKRNRIEEVSPATVNRELSGLRNIYNRAIEWGMAEKNPVKGVKFFREDEGRLRFLEKEEIRRLYDACPAYLKSIVALAVSTGMRKGEILSLKWLDVDFRRRIITILKTKGQKRREIPIGLGISRLLLRRRKYPDSPYIFCREDGRCIGSFRKAFESALKKAGIEDFTFHDLRHTFASHLVM
ncbi:site-specific integrase, partial [Candidatus Aerophobetes bacterium]